MKIWGKENIDQNTIDQFNEVMNMDVVIDGALMADAHLGYGMPIGGVAATLNEVMPFAVGFDIGCRMRLSVIEGDFTQADIFRALGSETRFGVGCTFDPPKDHPVLEEDWGDLRDLAWRQLGTSGSGNHFVDFGKVGERWAILSHSGSRGVGHKTCQKYIKHDWLSLDTDLGKAYWNEMHLCGRYAEANHEVIHDSLIKSLGARLIEKVENHHNFAWREGGLIVHRKGATPAGRGVLGVIPGTMATPAYVVRGKGVKESLYSAAHGAGRLMSRKEARRSLTKPEMDITLLGAGLDEMPGAYKDIETVMSAQRDLVEVIGKFHPKIVRMAQ